MEKIIFFVLVILIFAFVLYLGVNAIMKGVDAKNENRSLKNIDNEQEDSAGLPDASDQISTEINKLNQLFKDGVLTQEEFEKAKKKILGN